MTAARGPDGRRGLLPAAVRTRGLTKRFRQPDRGRRDRPRGADRGGLRLPRSERVGQDHDDPDAARPDLRRPSGSIEVLGEPMPGRRLPDAAPGRGAGRGTRVPPLPLRPGQPRPPRRRRPAQRRPYGAGPDRRRARPRRAAARGDQALPGVLARHAPAPGHRQRAARAARPAGARRADQRPRPAGHPRGAAPDRRARRRRHHRPRLEPPAQRGRPDVHPRRRDVRGQAAHAGPAVGPARRRRPRPCASTPTGPRTPRRCCARSG